MASEGQEVLTVKTMSIVTRPSALVAARTQVPVAAPRPSDVSDLRDPLANRVSVDGWASADASRLPQVHHIQVQAELGRGAVRRSEGNEITGSTVTGVTTSAKKRFVGGAHGVPPRGRPV